MWNAYLAGWTGLAMLFGQAAAGELPLPEATDIPEDYSTVICPDAEAARRMLTDYYRTPPNGGLMIDIPLFFDGLEATRCVQGGPLKVGTITIEQVLSRVELQFGDGGTSTYILFRGHNGNRAALTGIVDETANNAHPRTPFERWVRDQTSDGYLPPNHSWDNVGDRLFRCPSVGAARRAIAAIAGAGESQAARDTAFAAALDEQTCVRWTNGRYRVTAVYEEVFINCGHECESVWVALDAEDETGASVGLLYDSSNF
ncbi:MAG: hypothetical protein H7X93_02840 [Sphingomonadaceae bacterium]|nr:hypothetical protein [Sphingomonadaceae bacterium]